MNKEAIPGRVFAPIVRGAYTSSHIARWCAAQQNWDRIHYDAHYAVRRAGLPGTIINGALKQHLLAFGVEAALGAGSWIDSIDFRFVGQDLVGDTLQVEVELGGVDVVSDLERSMLSLSIVNQRTREPTTRGSAVVLRRTDGGSVLSSPMPAPTTRGSTSTGAPDTSDGGVPEVIRSRIGTILEDVTSYCPIERGRLVLFADAVMDVPAIYFDEAAAREGPYGEIVAPPLFPIHALMARPGERALSANPDAKGREGVCEIGRNLGDLFGLRAAGFLNGGNRVRLHSLARVGETVQGISRLAAVKRRTGKRGGELLIFETDNHYQTTNGRALLTERQTGICRMS